MADIAHISRPRAVSDRGKVGLTHQRDRIPQALWDQAVALARVMPHSRVAQHLRLSANALKTQMAMPHQETTAVPPLPLGFVEVPGTPVWPRPPSGTEIELSRPDGARLRIHSHEPQPPLVALVRTFLETPACSS